MCRAWVLGILALETFYVAGDSEMDADLAAVLKVGWNGMRLPLLGKWLHPRL